MNRTTHRNPTPASRTRTRSIPAASGPAASARRASIALAAALGAALALAAAALAPAPAAGQSSTFGNAVVIDGDRMIVGEPNNNFRPGTVYLYERAGGEWRETGTFQAPDAERADGFGALLALNGDVLFVAQRGGLVHAYERDGGGWSYAGTPVDGPVEGLDPGCNDYGYCGTDFGMSLATAGDWLLVGDAGAPVIPERTRRGSDETEADAPSGAVYAFERTGDGWVQRQRIEAPTPTPADAFGAAVALVDDGRVLIGAPRASSEAMGPGDAVQGTGRVYEYRLDGGAWSLVGELDGPAEVDAGFGAAIDADGEDGGRALIGAPGASEGSGAAYLFARSGDGWERTRTLDFPAGDPDDRFGEAVALAGDDLFVGSPVERGIETGMLFIFSEGGDEPTRVRFTEHETNTEDELGQRVVVSGDVAAVTATGLDHGAGGVFVWERDGDAWVENGLLVSPPDALGSVTGSERRCQEGAVELYECEDVELLSFVSTAALRPDGMNRGVRTNDNWGWTDPETGREYALVGRNDGTSFVDITNPADPVLVGDLPKTDATPRSQLWRDIKTYENHAFIVADGAGKHGMQVFDLTRLRDVTDPPVIFEEDVLYRGEGPNVVESIHNVIINEETGYAYLTSRECSGMHVVDIREPLAPTFVGCSDEGPTHDAQCLTYEGPDERYHGHEICLRMSGDRFQISDVTDKSNPVELAVGTHPNPAYMHQGWVTEDQRYFIMDDEADVIAGNVDRTRTLIWDISNLEDPQLAEEFMGSTDASAHNLYVKGDFTYQANYRYGIHILDTSDPLNPEEVGFFDTSPFHSGPGFSGAWSVYPFFDSESILVTSLQEGLFVVKKREVPIS